MENNPYSPPSLESTPPASEPSAALPPATLGQRFCASLLDTLLTYIPLLLVSSFAPVPYLNELLMGESMTSEALYAMVGYLVFIAVNFHLIRTRDQTVGKLALGIKVTTLSGKSPSTANQAGLRYGFYNLSIAIPFIGTLLSLVNVLYIFGAQRRCLHDLIAGTRVVQSRTTIKAL